VPGRPLVRGDIVLVPFPFTDLSARKVRPGIIISADPQRTDVILAFISSIVPIQQAVTSDFVLHSTHPEFPLTGLKRSSIFKMGKLLTLDRSMV